MTRKRRKIKNVSSFVDRHGKERWRYRKTGQPAYQFRNPPGTEAFKAELAACRAAAPPPVAANRAKPRTIADLVGRYYQSADFNGGGPDDQARRRGLIESFRAEFAGDLVTDFGFEHIEALLIARSAKRRVGKRTVGGKVAAYSLKKQLRRLFAHAVRLKWITSNPVEEAQTAKVGKTTGYHSWTEAEIAQYQKRHPLGTRARLALEIMLWTWQRRSDARLFGPEQMKRGKVNYTQGKTGKDLWLPAAPQLVEAIGAMQSVGLKTFLVTEYGKPFSKAGFGNKMREWCDEAGLPHCTAHGLRKAAARRAAERGAGNAGLKAAGGWSGDQEVAIYTAAVNQEQLAEDTLRRVIDHDLANRGSADLANPETRG
jgi:integrase